MGGWEGGNNEKRNSFHQLCLPCVWAENPPLMGYTESTAHVGGDTSRSTVNRKSLARGEEGKGGREGGRERERKGRGGREGEREGGREKER